MKLITGQNIIALHVPTKRGAVRIGWRNGRFGVCYSAMRLPASKATLKRPHTYANLGGLVA